MQDPGVFCFKEFPILFCALRRKPMQDDQRFRIIYHIFIYPETLLTNYGMTSKWWSWGDAIPRLAQSFVRLGHMLMLGLSSLCCSGSNDSQEIF